MRSRVVLPDPDGPEQDEELALAALEVHADHGAGRVRRAEDLGQRAGLDDRHGVSPELLNSRSSTVRGVSPELLNSRPRDSNRGSSTGRRSIRRPFAFDESRSTASGVYVAFPEELRGVQEFRTDPYRLLRLRVQEFRTDPYR